MEKQDYSADQGQAQAQVGILRKVGCSRKAKEKISKPSNCHANGNYLACWGLWDEIFTIKSDQLHGCLISNVLGLDIKH